MLPGLAVLDARKRCTVSYYPTHLALLAPASQCWILGGGRALSGGGYLSGKDPEHKRHFQHQALQPLLLSSPNCSAFQKGLYWRVSSCREDSDTRHVGICRGVCCGARWVGTVPRVCEGVGRREGRESSGLFELKSRTTPGSPVRLREPSSS